MLEMILSAVCTAFSANPYRELELEYTKRMYLKMGNLRAGKLQTVFAHYLVWYVRSGKDFLHLLHINIPMTDMDIINFIRSIPKYCFFKPYVAEKSKARQPTIMS